MLLVKPDIVNLKTVIIDNQGQRVESDLVINVAAVVEGSVKQNWGRGDGFTEPPTYDIMIDSDYHIKVGETSIQIVSVGGKAINSKWYVVRKALSTSDFQGNFSHWELSV